VRLGSDYVFARRFASRQSRREPPEDCERRSQRELTYLAICILRVTVVGRLPPNEIIFLETPVVATSTC
jgi:hypothetical protein